MVTHWADSLLKGGSKLPEWHNGFYGFGSKRCVLSDSDLLSLQDPDRSSCSTSSNGTLTGTVIEGCISLMLEECTLRQIAVVGSLNTTNPQRPRSLVTEHESSLFAAKQDIGLSRYAQPAFYMLVVNTNSEHVKPFFNKDRTGVDMTGAVPVSFKPSTAVPHPEKPPHWVLFVCETGVPAWRSYDSLNGDHASFALQQHRVLFGTLTPPPFRYTPVTCPVQKRWFHSGDFVVAFAMSAIKNQKLPAQAFSASGAFGSVVRLYIAKTVLTNNLSGERQIGLTKLVINNKQESGK